MGDEANRRDSAQGRAGAAGSRARRGQEPGRKKGHRAWGRQLSAPRSAEEPSESRCGHRALGLKTSRRIGGGRASQAGPDPDRPRVPVQSSQRLCFRALQRWRVRI